MPDLTVQNEGTIVVIYPESDEGRDWMLTHVEQDGMRWAGGYACDWRSGSAIIEGAQAEGLSVESYPPPRGNAA